MAYQTIDDMFDALKPAAEQVAAAVGCEVLRAILSEGYGDKTSDEPVIAATKERAVRNAYELSDTLALTYCPRFGATRFKLAKGGDFTGVIGYHSDGTPLVCIIRGTIELNIGEDAAPKVGYLAIATVYSLVPKSSDRLNV